MRSVKSSGFATVNTDAEASFDKLIVKLNDPADPADDNTPYIDRPSVAESAVYHCIGTYKNDTNGDEITFDAWLDLQMTIEVDTENKTVKKGSR